MGLYDGLAMSPYSPRQTEQIKAAEPYHAALNKAGHTYNCTMTLPAKKERKNLPTENKK